MRIATPLVTRARNAAVLIQCVMRTTALCRGFRRSAIPPATIAQFVCSQQLATLTVMLNIALNRERFIKILAALVDETPKLQNNPPKLVPEEDRAAKIVMDALR